MTKEASSQALGTFQGRSKTLREQGNSSHTRSLLDRLLRKNNRSEYDLQLNELIDPEQDYEKFQKEGLKTLNPRVLYQARLFDSKTEFFRHNREEAMSCLQGDTVTRPLISPIAYKELQKSEYKLVHLGLIVPKEY